MQITEPTTLLTDLLLAALAFLFAFRLLRDPRRRSRHSVAFWAAGFIAAGASAAAGGTVHGFVRVLGEPASAALWKLTVYLVGFGGWAFLVATAFATLRGRLRWVLIILATAKLAVYAVWMIDHKAFRYVVYDYAPALLLVLLFFSAAFLLRREAASSWIIVGVLLSFGGAGIQMSGFSLHRHFNHNDLYHVVQMMAFYLWYRGGMLLRDR